MKPDLTVIVLTFNEEQHIERCLRSLWPVATAIFVIDSFSDRPHLRAGAGNGRASVPE